MPIPHKGPAAKENELLIPVIPEEDDVLFIEREMLQALALPVLLHLLGGLFETIVLGMVHELAVVAVNGQVVLAVLVLVDVEGVALAATVAGAFGLILLGRRSFVLVEPRYRVA